MDERGKRVGQLLIWVVLAVPLISLAGGLVLSVKGLSVAENWRSAFLLRSHPLWSLVFLASLATAHWILFKYRWLTFVTPWEVFKSINYVFQATVVLTLVFYAGLVVQRFCSAVARLQLP